MILEPLQITKSFDPTSIAVNGSSTLTFSINNPNVVAMDASFTDTLPAWIAGGGHSGRNQYLRRHGHGGGRRGSISFTQ